MSDIVDIDIIEKEYRKRVGESNFKPPVDLQILKEVISDIKEVKIELEPIKSELKGGGVEAILVPLSGKFIIKAKNVDLKNIKHPRQRTTICHEFSHILLYGTPSYHDESKCFKMARRLLIPMEMLENDENVICFTKDPFESFKKLCKNYASSKEIMSARLTKDMSSTVNTLDYFKNIIITFWYRKNENISEKHFSWDDFKTPYSCLSSELTKSFPYDRRKKLYGKILEEIKKEINRTEESKEIKNPFEITIGEKQKKQCELYIYKWYSDPLYFSSFNFMSITKVKEQI